MRFLKAGILTSIQDLGRFGFQKMGINPSGVMDRSSFRKVNLLLQNKKEEAVLEFHFPGPKIEFEENLEFVLGGADFNAYLNFKPIALYEAIHASPGDILEFRSKKLGERAYMGVKNGFDIPLILNSKSTHLLGNFGGFIARNNAVLKANDSLIVLKNHHVKIFIKDKNRDFERIRIIAGPDFNLLKEESQRDLLMNVFLISNQSNRMGYRLFGPELKRENNNDILSDSVAFGTVQLLPSGQLICLMADSQTTGGYPRIAKVIEPDLSLLAQMGPNSSFRFELISLEKAEKLYLQNESYFRKLEISYNLALKNGE